MGLGLEFWVSLGWLIFEFKAMLCNVDFLDLISEILEMLPEFRAVRTFLLLFYEGTIFIPCHEYV